MFKARNDISDSSRQKYTNKEIKKDYRLEEYLKIVRNPAHRITMTKLRLGVHTLRIQTGKYENKGASMPVEERLCLVCKRNCIEDEKHFLIVVLNTKVLDGNFTFIFLKMMQPSSI